MKKGQTMNNVKQHLSNKGNFIQWIVIAILAGSMFSGSRRAIMPMLLSVARFLAPFVIIWFVIKLIKNKISGVFVKFQEQMTQGVQNGASTQSAAGFGGMRQGRKDTQQSGQVLDLCPKCGSLLAGHHHCEKK